MYYFIFVVYIYYARYIILRLGSGEGPFLIHDLSPGLSLEQHDRRHKWNKNCLGTDHLTCSGGEGVLWVFFSYRNLFSNDTRVRIFFFQNITLGYMTKTLNQIILFSSTKIRTLEIRIFFRKKPLPPPLPLEVKWSVPYPSGASGPTPGFLVGIVLLYL